MATRRKPMSEINVVPLIDVMLVLLVVSMVTVPLLTQGIPVNLPQDSSDPLEEAEDDPLVVTIREDGRMYLNVGTSNQFDENSNISEEVLRDRASKVLDARPRVPVFVRADAVLQYGEVIDVISMLQEIGATNVGLITEPVEMNQ